MEAEESGLHRSESQKKKKTSSSGCERQPLNAFFMAIPATTCHSSYQGIDADRDREDVKRNTAVNFITELSVKCCLPCRVDTFLADDIYFYEIERDGQPPL